MGTNFVRSIQPGPNQISGSGMVSSEAGGLPVTDKIGAAVANMYQMQGILKNIRGGKSCTHPAYSQSFSRFVYAQVG